MSPHRARTGEDGRVSTVSKAHLDVAVESEAEVRRVSNDEAGIEALVSDLAALNPSLVVLEGR